jgi:hypothetical protein
MAAATGPEPTTGVWGRGCGRRCRPSVELPAAADAVQSVVLGGDPGDVVWVGGSRSEHGRVVGL